MDPVADHNARMLELLKLDARMYLMFAVGLIALIGLVLIIFTQAGARAIRRIRPDRPKLVPPDDWARRPAVEEPRDDHPAAGSDP